MNDRPLSVSVVVATRNRAGTLGECLSSIACDRSKHDREVVVVDNGSTDGTAEVVRRLADEAEGIEVRLVREPRPGKSRALNAGVATARGELLLFTDDDAVVEPGWTDRLAAAFEDPAVGAAGGRILPQWIAPMPPWLDGPHAAVVALRDWGTEERDFVQGELPIGANMAVRRAAIPTGSAFDTRLGHRPGAPMGSEENALLFAIRRSWRLRYVPAAVVVHRIEAERLRWSAIARRFFYFGVGEARLLRLADVTDELPPLRQRVGAFRRGVQAARGSTTWREDPPDPVEAQRRLDRLFRLGYGAELLFGRWSKLADGVEAAIAAFTLPRDVGRR